MSWPMPDPGNIVPFRDNDGLHEATIPDIEFWHSRPELQSLYENSRRYITSPWGALGMALMRSLHSIPSWVAYRSFKGRAPLNAILALTGPTGGGKSVLAGQLDECMPFHAGAYGFINFHTIEPGSGEALPDAYAHTADKDDPDRNISRGDLVWHNKQHAMMFGYDEVGRMFKLGEKSSATVYEYTKTAWSGSSLGRKLSGQNNGVQLPRGSYRFTMIVNAQPALCGSMFTPDEIEGGFPGRIIWMGTNDPNAEAEHDPTPVVPHMIKDIDWSQVREIRALPEMDEAHVQDSFRFHRGERPPLEAHEVLLRAKIAIALMRLNDRIHLNYQDWELAGVVVAESTRVRTVVQQLITNQKIAKDTEQGKAIARQAAAADEAAETLAVKRIVERLRGFAEKGKPEREWKQALASRDRELYAQALEQYRGTS